MEKEIKKTTSDLEKKIENRISQMQQNSLEIGQKIIDQQKEKIEHINSHYQGKQRDFKLNNFRNEFVEDFIDMSVLRMSIENNEYFDIIKSELISLYKTE